jgi:hypothetical protein
MEPAGAPAKAKGGAKYQVKGAVVPGADSPAGAGMVALLLPGGLSAQLRQSRTLLTAAPSSTILWPYDSFQKFAARVQDQEPLCGTLTTAQGTFEFEKPVVPGTYLVTVGLPTRRAMVKPLPPDWPAQLQTTQRVSLAGCELIVPALSGWFVEVKVEAGDREISLGGHEYIRWPSAQLSAADLRPLTKHIQDIQRHDRDAKAAENQLTAAEQKAQTTGQPLHVKAVNDLKAKAKAAEDAKTGVISEVEGLAKRLIPDAQPANQPPASQ